MGWVIDRSEWLGIYDRIRSCLPELNYEKDQEATDLLSSQLVKHSSAIDLREFYGRIGGCEVAIVFGCSDSLQEEIELVRKVVGFEKALLVAADGAVNALLDRGLIPHLVISDLDGNLRTLLEVSGKGSIVAVHAHGDNIQRLSMVFLLKGPVIGSTQVEPRPLVYNFGGFTDGDRAVYMLFHAGYRKVYLAGFNFEKPHNCPGKPLVSPEIKRKKLEVARWLISRLEDRGLEVVVASVLRGGSRREVLHA